MSGVSFQNMKATCELFIYKFGLQSIMDKSQRLRTPESREDMPGPILIIQPDGLQLMIDNIQVGAAGTEEDVLPLFVASMRVFNYVDEGNKKLKSLINLK